MKKARFLISVLAVICIMIASVGLVACEPTEVIPPEPPAPPIVVEGPEAGVYYDVDGTDQYIILNAGNMFVLSVGEKPRAGVYTLENGALTLTFVKTSETEETASGTLTAEEITLTYGDKTIVFRKTASYTVRFEVNGGSAVNSQKVAIGKQAIEPETPVKEGSLFLGWYADAAFTERYDFTKKVTSDTIIYAKWAERVVGQEEYVIGYDLGYTGEKIAETTTFGGKLHNVAEPAPRSGYKFGGWWISMYDDGTRLSYKYTEGMNFREDTTLYAMWIPESTGNKLASPVVNVTDKGASWDNIAGASTYRVKVEGPVGFTTVEKNNPTPMYSIDFANSPAGDYTITVVAASTATDGDSEPTVRHYKNKALARVSKFNVIDNSVLVFTGVENAKEYYIRVNCGDELHNHSAHALGNVTSFDFMNCPMGEDGISFVVTAKANGYASSDSRAFVYNRVLDKIEELKYDEATQVVSWDNVQDAAGYIVSVRSGETELIVDDIGKVNRFNLKEFAPTNGKLVVSVYPVAKGYNSPEATTLTCNKTVLATPQNIRIIGNILYWDEVADATKYEITIGDKTITAEKPAEGELRYDLTEALGETPAEDYVLKIRAIDASGNGSLWSDAIDVRYNKMYATLAYSRNEVSWRHVIGAVRYEVRVNNGEVISVTDGKNSAKVTLTAENNVIEVRYVYMDGETEKTSDWANIEVEAYEVIFKTNGGEEIASIYLALGDKVVLPDAVREHYNFMGWYNSPKGPIGNGMRYEESYLTEASPQVVYAFYEAVPYGITLEVDDGVLEETFVERPYGAEYTLPVPTIDDGTLGFGGWYAGPNGTGAQYTDEKGNSLRPFEDGKDIKLYAFWQTKLLSFELTYVGTRQAYSVTKGSGISMTNTVTIPIEYKGLPVLMIGPGAFRYCSNLEVIHLPNTIELISTANPFSSSSKLREVNVYPVEGNSRIRYWSEGGVLIDDGRLDEQVPGKIVSTISFIPPAKTGSYTIPNKVTALGYKVFASSKITEITIPAAVTEIGEEAFYNCAELTKVIFEKPEEGKEVKPLKIGAKAFSNCKKLTEFTVPARAEEIKLGRYTLTQNTGTDTYNISISSGAGVTDIFYNCSALASIQVEEGSKSYKSIDGVIYNHDGTELIYCPEYKTTADGKAPIAPGTVKIAAGAFVDCDEFTSLEIPNTVQEIGECAFYSCGYITKVTFKAGATGAIKATKIGRFAFRQCSDLIDVIFEKGSQVTEIGEGAFYQCYDIVTFVIPDTMEKVGKQAFRNCSNLTVVEFAESDNPRDVSFEDDVFYGCTKLTTFYLPKNVVKLPGVFSGCTALKEVLVDPANPNFTDVDGILYNKDKTELLFWPMGRGGVVTLEPTVTTLVNGIFRNNANITEITIGANVESIGNEAFRSCTNLMKVTFEQGDKPLDMGTYVFADCDSLVSLELPGRITEIRDNAIYSLNSLEKLNLGEGITKIGYQGIYMNYELKELHIPASVTEIGDRGVAYNNKLEKITFEPNSQLETIVDYGLYHNNFKTITIPKSVKTIGYRAFFHTESDSYGNKAKNPIEEILFEEGSLLEEIGPQAFYYAINLKSITIPKSVKHIGYNAFSSCDGLTEVKFEKGGTEDLVIGGFSKYKMYPTSSTFNYGYGAAFYSCDALKSIEIPARAVEIGHGTFQYCYALENVTFEEGGKVRTIGEKAFYYCSNLKSIKLPNSIGNDMPLNNPDYPNDAAKAYDRPAIGKNAFYYCDELVSFEIEDGENTAPITIAEDAFYRCKKLTSIKIPGRLGTYKAKDGSDWVGMTIIEDVLYACESLSEFVISDVYDSDGNLVHSEQRTIDNVIYNNDYTEILYSPEAIVGVVNISNKVTRVKAEAFYARYGITKFIFEEGNDEVPLVIEADAFRDCDGLGGVFHKAGETNAEGKVCSEDGMYFDGVGYHMVLPNRTTEIGERAFRHSSFLISFTIPKNLKEFDSSIIEQCMKLVDIKVADGHTSLQAIDGVLYDKLENGGKSKLLFYPYPRVITTFTVPEGIVEIGNRAFMLCSSLKTIQLPSTLTRIGAYAFEGCTSLESVTIPKAVTMIDDRAFYQCSSLEKVIFEADDSAERKDLSIGSGKSQSSSYVFYQTYALKSLSLPERTTSIANYALGYAGISEINMPSTLTGIGNYAFYHCESLEKINWASDSKISKFGNYAFTYCHKLKEFTFPESITEVGNYVLAYNDALKTVTLNKKLSKMGTAAFYQDDMLETVIFPADIALEELPLQTFAYSGIKEITIPYTIMKINSTSSTNSPFYSCNKLEKVTFAKGPNGESPRIEAFGNYLFYKSNFKTITIPSSVTEFGTYLFRDSLNLEEVIFEDGCFIEEFKNYTFEGCTALKNIVNMPQSVTKFGNYVFSETAITSMVLPTSLKEIGTYTFSKCTALTEVVIPATLKDIGTYTFNGCTALVKVEWPDALTEIPDYTFQGCSSLKEINIPKATKYGKYCFSGAGIETFTIPSTVTTMGDFVFSKCAALVEVKFENAPTKLPSSFFRECSSLKEIKIPDTVTDLTSTYIFYKCTSLEKVTFPNNNSIKKLGNDMFEGCTSLKDVTIPSTVEEIGSYVFRNTGITKITVPNTVKKIGGSAFRGCVELTDIVLPDNKDFEKIDSYMFDGNVKLASITIPTTVTEIGTYAFGGTAITRLDIPDSVTKMGTYVFSASQLETISIPASLKDLGNNTFKDCVNLREVNMSSGLTSIGDKAFENCVKLVDAFIPDTVVKIGTNPFMGCTSLAAIQLSEQNTAFSVVDGVLYANNDAYEGAKTMLICPAGKQGTLTLPADVVEIATYAASGATVSEVIIPDDVKIGTYAFANSSIKKITFGKNNTLGASMLRESTVSEIIFPDEILAIPSYFASDCLELKAVTIPASVTEIGSYAFRNTAITSVVIPNTVVEIEMSAFNGCVNLATVEFATGGTEALIIGNNAFKGCTALKAVKIPYRVRTTTTVAVGSGAFQDCSALETVEIETNPATGAIEGVINFGGSAFRDCVSLKRIEFPKELGTTSGVTVPISSYIFRGCIALEEVVFNFTENAPKFMLQSGSFIDCKALKKFVVPENITGLSANCFEGSGLEELIIPATVKTMGKEILLNCVNLKKVEMYSEYNSIQTSMFEGCTSLTSFEIPATAKTINERAFANCTSMKSIYIPATVTKVNAEVFSGWTAEQTIYFAAETPAGWDADWALDCNAQIKWGVSPDQYPQP